MKNGYLTVYLSLSLSLILSLVLTLVEGARINTIHMEAECVADIAMNSVLAEFHRELLEQYDLLFVDMSYGTEHAAIENSAEHLRKYMQCNFSAGERTLFPARDWLSLTTDKVKIQEYSVASDKGGGIMKRQALEYMKGSTPEGMLGKIMEQAGQVKSFGLDTRDIDGERSRIQGQIDSIELPYEENEDGEQVEIKLNNPADRVNGSRNSFILSLVLEDSAAVSQAVINAEDYISQRAVMTGIGTRPEFEDPSGITDKLLFNEYLMDKCGRYGNQLNKSLMKYQIEYILHAKDSDLENLEKTAGELLKWREAANVIYIFTDSAKCAQAEAVALTLTAVLQVPLLLQPVKCSILFAWAYVESLYDVKCLFKGGKVPIMKTAGEWKTSIESVLGFSGNIPDSSGCASGLSYDDYLKIMLYLKDDIEKNMHAMDIMEMDIRRTPGNQFFRMDACFDSYLAKVTISSGFGYHYELQRRYEYQ